MEWDSQVLDSGKVATFFNQLELEDEAHQSDLQLLLEAERRGLLDEVCSDLLKEARKRGLVSSKPPFDIPAKRYDVKSLGTSPIVVGGSNGPSDQEIAVVVERLQKSDASGGLVFEIAPDGITLLRTPFSVESYFHTMKIARHKPTPKKEEMQVVERLMLPSIFAVRKFERSVCCIIRVKKRGSTSYVAQLYRFKDKKKAGEAVDTVNEICVAVLNRRMEQDKHEQLFPTEHYVLPVVATGSQALPPTYPFGLKLEGPFTHEQEPGIFIEQVEDESPAARCGLKPGYQVLEVNSVNVEFKTVNTVTELLANCSTEVKIAVRWAPDGFAMAERRAGRNRPEVMFKGAMSRQSSGATILESAIDSELSTVTSEL